MLNIARTVSRDAQLVEFPEQLPKGNIQVKVSRRFGGFTLGEANGSNKGLMNFRDQSSRGFSASVKLVNAQVYSLADYGNARQASE
ncbi:MAG: hypothetical protein WCL11_20175 [Verrucomicrobiota bacterium]